MAASEFVVLAMLVVCCGCVSGVASAMPSHEACFILLPKSLLWLGLVRSGVHYLMETAGIVDVIVNAMALTFVLQVHV